MNRLCAVLSGILLLSTLPGIAGAGSRQALELRKQYGLLEYAPPEGFLTGNFIADEVEPGFIFGKVSDFVKSRPCPLTWLIEDKERKRIEACDPSAGPIEYSLYLEEACPGKVVHYVFIDRSQCNSAQWMEWRQQFHKSKTESQYGAVKNVMEQAGGNGFPVSGELRFVESGGELLLKRPEDFLMKDLHFPPIYDLKAGKALAP